MSATATGPSGNVYPKFSTGNPIARALVGGYKEALRELVLQIEVDTLLEVGCGEGYVMEFLDPLLGARMNGMDVDTAVVRGAAARCPDSGFAVGDGHELPYPAGAFDLVLACEVLEHVSDPHRVLGELARVTRRHALVSVPREPIWRILNVLRGAYLRDLGNTPGHVQHWSRQGFLSLLSRHFDIVATRSPLPWTMVLLEKRP